MLNKQNTTDTGQRYEVRRPDGTIVGWTDSEAANDFGEDLGEVMIVDRQVHAEPPPAKTKAPDAFMAMVGDELFTPTTTGAWLGEDPEAGERSANEA